MNTPSRGLVLPLGYWYTSAVLIVSILAWALGLPGVLLRAEAAPLTSVSDTLSTSGLGLPANHAISFVTPTGVPADGSTIEITIPAGFAMPFIGEDDVDIADDGVDLTTGATCGAVQAAVSTSSQKITIEICTGGGGAIDATSVVTIEVGQNAMFSGTGVHQITNHVTGGAYDVAIEGTMADEGFTKVFIVDRTRVTGEVNNYLDFEIIGVDAGEVVNADATLTFATTTATSVAFGLIDPASEYLLAQDISVSTNAESGFMVTVLADGDLQSTSGASIDSFSDGTNVATPLAWDVPSAQYGSPDTYGHWGLTTEDSSLSDDDSFGDALYVGNFVNTPREVMFATSSADGTTEHIGATRVGYKMEISVMQEASSEYTTRLVYVVTPIF